MTEEARIKANELVEKIEIQKIYLDSIKRGKVKSAELKEVPFQVYAYENNYKTVRIDPKLGIMMLQLMEVAVKAEIEELTAELEKL
jgi:hypothetical protein